MSIHTLIKFIYCNIQGLGLKYSYGNISVVDDFFDQWDPSTATSIEEINEPQWGLC